MQPQSLVVAFYAAVAVMAVPALGFYVPGTTPNSFERGDKVELKVNKIMSSKTQMPYSYYTLPVCQPPTIEETSITLGEILAGDRLESTPYALSFNEDAGCSVLCRKVFTEEEAALARQRINEDYRVSWVVDNLPSALQLVDVNNPDDVRYQRGIPIGFVSDQKPTAHFLFNHVRFLFSVHTERDTGARRIVAFLAVPYSVKHTYSGAWDDSKHPQLATCSFFQPVSAESPLLSVDTAGEVIYTYEVKWVASDTPWSHRWDLYLKGAEDASMHWWSIINSAVVVLFLTGMIAIILVQALRRDIVAINNDDEDDETGWKLVHGDVFRPPSGLVGPMVLSVLVGSGVQLSCMCGSLMLFAILGILSPANRGALATALVVCFVLMGAFAGFVSSRIYKMFLGKLWARNAILTATVLPGTIGVIAFTLNMVLWSYGSTLALPFGTMVAIAAMWFFISTPLVMAGAYVGFTRDAIEPTVRVSTFARTVSAQPFYLHPVITALVGGVLPFGAVFIELYFIMTSIWTAQPYYVFGFLTLVLFILAVTCAEISIVMCYFQLCAEDHRWWWRAFLNPGASALYVFLYSIFYFATSLDITDPASATLYFGNMLMVAFAFFLLTGSIGFLSTFAFVRYIYSQIKVE